MANLPDVMEQALCNHYLKTAGSTTYGNVTSASLWVGLCTAAPTDSTTNECTVGSYARKQIVFTTADAQGAATGPTATTNFEQITGTAWGTINGYIVCAASTGSTGTSAWLFYGAVSPTVATTLNDTVSFAANAMTLTFA